MKKIVLLFIAIFPLLALRAQTAQPEMKFDHTEHNFGKISDKADPVSHTFTFTNTGKAPLVILSIETSCNCTKAVYSKRPIPAGESSEVVITYDPKRQSGVFYKAIQIFTNEPQKRRIITAQGEVVKGK